MPTSLKIILAAVVAMLAAAAASMARPTAVPAASGYSNADSANWPQEVSSLSDAMDATVRIDVVTARGPAIGSGVIIAEDTVLTAGHVVDGALAVSVTLHDGTVVENAKVLWSNFDEIGGLDLALVKVETGDMPIARTGCDDTVEAGDLLHGIGMPYGEQWFYAEGKVATLNDIFDRGGWVYTAAITGGPGSSGGPLFDEDWNIVGIFHATWRHLDSMFLVQSQQSICSVLAR